LQPALETAKANRRARGNSARPIGQDSRARLIRGLKIPGGHRLRRAAHADFRARAMSPQGIPGLIRTGVRPLDAQVSQLDCDSMQITDPVSLERFFCRVGSPDFTPPELMNADWKTTVPHPPATCSRRLSISMRCCWKASIRSAEYGADVRISRQFLTWPGRESGRTRRAGRSPRVQLRSGSTCCPLRSGNSSAPHWTRLSKTRPSAAGARVVPGPAREDSPWSHFP
jgi:hypothetical protein